MGFLLKKESADTIQRKYKNSYIKTELDLSSTYVSQILHRNKPVSKRTALAFAKVINPQIEIEDIFEQVK